MHITWLSFTNGFEKISDHYELRGDIYVKGIMHGEARACLETGEYKLQDFALHQQPVNTKKTDGINYEARVTIS
jgi:hypothetical protein